MTSLSIGWTRYTHLSRGCEFSQKVKTVANDINRKDFPEDRGVAAGALFANPQDVKDWAKAQEMVFDIAEVIVIGFSDDGYDIRYVDIVCGTDQPIPSYPIPRMYQGY